MALTLHDAEQIREAIVDPIIERLDERNAALLQTIEELKVKVESQDGRISDLEGLKAKLFFVAAGVGLIAGAFWDWLKKKFGL